MPIQSVETLLAILQRMQVLTSEEAQEVARELRPHFSDPVDLAHYLAEHNWLTEYQVRLLFTERWEELAVGPYVVLDRLGEGGISVVLKAWDTLRGRPVALKVLRPHLSDRDAALRELQRELHMATRLSHPNIITIYEADQIGTVYYFAMEFVEGIDLDRHVRQSGPMPIDLACDCIRQVAQGLQHAHQVGLVHRDIKPANLFLIGPPAASGAVMVRRSGSDPAVKILDWGLARLRPDACTTVDRSKLDRDAEKGMLVGTADYIAPEQARDPCLVDVRADIYSLGCTLYFLLTGQPPFRGNSLMQKLLQHQEAERPQVRELRPDVPEDLATLIQRMMAKRPEDRFPIPLLVAAPLRRYSSGSGLIRLPAPAGSAPRTGPGKPATSINLNIRPPSDSGM